MRFLVRFLMRFLGCFQFQHERVDVFHLFGKAVVDGSVSLQARESCEVLRDDSQREMTFSFVRSVFCACVSEVSGRIVCHKAFFRREGCQDLLA